MTPDRLEKRRTVMRRSMALGHCICDPRQPCPCPQFQREDICHCAGEHPPAQPGDSVRLTAHVRAAGCASKIPQSVLKEVLAGLPAIEDPRVVVGANCGDDAGVIMLGGTTEVATILTVDVFAPAVDDPYLFGQIAAANSLSDIYAMGGTPQVALSIVGFPVDTLPHSALREILRGGAAKMQEAGVPIIGGHSLNDAEVKCGFAVVGTCPRGRYVRNAGAQVGDALVLTKPLGGGIVAFGRQLGRVSDAASAAVGASMATLNRRAGELMVQHGVHAATDVTGFGLLGHLVEIVRHSGPNGMEVELDFDRIPLFPEAAALAAAEVLPGAVERNRESVPPDLLDLAALTPGQQGLLLGPETSGGILAFLPRPEAEAYLRDLHAAGSTAASIIGHVVREHPGGRIRAVATAAQPARPQEIQRMREAPSHPSAEPCCCADAPVLSTPPSPDTALPAPASAEAFRAYMAAAGAPGSIDAKHKKLMALALSVATRCEPCIKINARAAREAGASDAQIAEAAALGIAFGGAPAAMLYNTVRAK